MIIAYMRVDESYTKEKVEDEQETNVLLMEKLSLLTIRGALNLLFYFILIKGNEEMQHIKIKACRLLIWN